MRSSKSQGSTEGHHSPPSPVRCYAILEGRPTCDPGLKPTDFDFQNPPVRPSSSDFFTTVHATIPYWSTLEPTLLQGGGSRKHFMYEAVKDMLEPLNPRVGHQALIHQVFDWQSTQKSAACWTCWTTARIQPFDNCISVVDPPRERVVLMSLIIGIMGTKSNL
uniref:Uncharacterized protein n=1 Tax=Coccidioides posadasii RMSCC 3488 TaxID=454284 RepID=A0A0J6I1S3_COCPO|nr:hypothetical protein CPAG_01583 [Coccidioides posadasii RMSCC 3488]